MQNKERQRVCLTLDLKDDPDLIRQYVHHHKRENNWPEINEGIRKAGIRVMDIYMVDTRMFMICEVDEDADFKSCWEEVGTYPRQGDWAELMNNFIQALPGHKVEWVKMEQVYSLPEK